MSLDALIMLFGALIAVMPFLGFTVDMQKWIIFVLGLIVVSLGIALRRRGQVKPQAKRRRGEFIESSPAEPSTRNRAHAADPAVLHTEGSNA
jgi:hypothetical protein